MVGPAPGDPIVAGLPLLLRTALALQEAGVKELFLLSVPAGRLLTNPLVCLLVREAEPPPGPPALVLSAATCASPGVVKALVRSEVAPDAIRGIGSAEAAVWAAGGVALPRLLAQLRSSGPNPAATLVPPAPPDFVVAVGDAAAASRAERLLLATLRKPTDGFTARHLNRAISLPLSAALCRTGISPTQVTFLAFVIGMASVVPLLAGGRGGFMLGALLLQIHSILDGCDGELARLLYRRSKLGAWADQVSDDLVNLAFLIAAGVWLDRAGYRLAAPVTLIAALSFVVYQIALYVALWTRGGRKGSVTSLRWWGQGGPGQAAPGIRIPAPLTSAVEDLLRRDSFTFAYLPCAILGLPMIAFLWQAGVAIISGVVTSLQWVVAGGPQPADSSG